MLAAGGAMAGFIASAFVPRRYEGTARFVFISPYDGEAPALFDRASEVTLLPQSLELMIRRSPYFKNRLYVDSVADLITETRANLNVKSSATSGEPGGLIRFDDDEVDTALEVTRVILSEFGNNAAGVANAKKAGDVIRITEAPQTRLTGLTPALLTGIGLASGLLLALLVWILLPRARS
jgi:hypothetical protein